MLLLLFIFPVLLSAAVTNNARDHQSRRQVETTSNEHQRRRVLQHDVRLTHDSDDADNGDDMRDMIRRGYQDWERFKQKHGMCVCVRWDNDSIT